MTLSELPRDIQQRICADLDVSLRCTLACVCKHFRDLSLTPGFWEDVELDVGKFQKKGSSGVAEMLHFLAKRITTRTRMRLYSTLQPPDPYKPVTDACDWARTSFVPLLMGLGINRGISKLSLDLNNISLPVQTEILGILPWCSSLQELEVENICMADANQLNALKKLSHIRGLALKFNSQAAAIVRQSLQGGFPEKLASLSSLKNLKIHRAGYLGNLPEEVGDLKQLETLDLSNGSVLTGLPRSFSRLTALKTARLEHFGASDLSSLAFLPKLQTLHLSGGRMPVELASCSQLTALTLLLRDVPEHQIELGFSRMLGYSPQAEEWQHLLPQKALGAPTLGQQLRVLHIAGTQLGSVPQAFTQLPNLKHLSLTQCSLFDLPEGPYISGLETLILRQNFFIEVPQTLRAAAPRLEELDLSYNLLRPSEADIETVLQLPSLKHLWITKAVVSQGPERFRQNLSSWTAYSMDCLFKLAARHAAQKPAFPLNMHIFEPRPLEA